MLNYQRVYYTDWWFGTMEFYDFPIQLGIIIPTSIFFRGVETTNQYNCWIYRIYI